MSHTTPRPLSSFTLARGTRLVAAGMLAAVIGSLALTAYAMPGGGPGGMQYGGPGIGMMMGGRGMERMLDSVNASAEQRAQIKAIFERARTDMQAQRESGRAMRQQMMALFSQPVVDANAVEALRQQSMQRHDAASRRMTQAMVEASRVLSPEQRKQLAERAARRGEMMERHLQERRALDGATPAPR